MDTNHVFFFIPALHYESDVPDFFLFPAAKKKTEAADSDQGSAKPPSSPFDSSVSGVSLPQQFICSLSLIHGHRKMNSVDVPPQGSSPSRQQRRRRASKVTHGRRSLISKVAVVANDTETELWIHKHNQTLFRDKEKKKEMCLTNPQ